MDSTQNLGSGDGGPHARKIQSAGSEILGERKLQGGALGAPRNLIENLKEKYFFRRPKKWIFKTNFLGGREWRRCVQGVGL